MAGGSQQPSCPHAPARPPGSASTAAPRAAVAPPASAADGCRPPPSPLAAAGCARAGAEEGVGEGPSPGLTPVGPGPSSAAMRERGAICGEAWKRGVRGDALPLAWPCCCCPEGPAEEGCSRQGEGCSGQGDCSRRTQVLGAADGAALSGGRAADPGPGLLLPLMHCCGCVGWSPGRGVDLDAEAGGPPDSRSLGAGRGVEPPSARRLAPLGPWSAGSGRGR